MYANCLKRVFDFLLALCAITVLSPVLLLLILMGAIAMGGNPFFTQLRPGRISKKTGKETIFRLVKFRTMSNARDKEGNLLPDDKRLNKYGKFLRSTSLDELPELFNILAGQMAIVGPRPLLVEYLPYYTEEERLRHTVRPGLTGLAQVNGRNTVSWEKRFELDVQYRNNLTFLNDVKIIIGTVKAVLSRDSIELNALENFDEYRKKQLQNSDTHTAVGTIQE
jgi:lipopolysaccharide/colanic/teichoic acid biosynthesis glycosyltransferase